MSYSLIIDWTMDGFSDKCTVTWSIIGSFREASRESGPYRSTKVEAQAYFGL